MIGWSTTEPPAASCAHAFLRDRVEVELRLRIGRVGRQLVDLLAADLEERRGAAWPGPRACSGVRSGIGDRERARQAQRLVLAVADVAALQRARRPCSSRALPVTVASTTAAPFSGWPTISPMRSSDGAVDVQRQVRRAGLVQRDRALPGDVDVRTRQSPAASAALRDSRSCRRSTAESIASPPIVDGAEVDAPGDVDRIDRHAARRSRESSSRRRPTPVSVPGEPLVAGHDRRIEVWRTAGGRDARRRRRRSFVVKSMRGKLAPNISESTTRAGRVERQRIAAAAASRHVEAWR